MGLFGIWEGKRKGQRVEGGGLAAPACLPEYLNASTPERTDNSHDKHPEAPTSTDKQEDNREGANLAPPGWWSGEGGGYLLHNARYENRK